MRSTLKVAFVALALAGGSLTFGLPAQAEVTVAVNPGGVAFGYSDGYWDQGHHWHAWRNRQEAAEFRSHNPGHYYNRRHSRVSGQGWRGNDMWWNHH